MKTRGFFAQREGKWERTVRVEYCMGESTAGRRGRRRRWWASSSRIRFEGGARRLTGLGPSRDPGREALCAEEGAVHRPEKADMV